MLSFGDQSHAAYEIIWVSFFTLRIQTFNVKVYNALCHFFSADFLRDYWTSVQFLKEKRLQYSNNVSPKILSNETPQQDKKFFSLCSEDRWRIENPFLSLHAYLSLLAVNHRKREAPFFTIMQHFSIFSSIRPPIQTPW